MRFWRRLSRRQWVVAGLTFAVAGFLAAFVFIVAGVYNVAASRGHAGWLDAVLALSMRRSVEMRSIGIDVPPLDDDELVQLGAMHYQAGCGVCHGAPGRASNAMFAHLLPQPPDLAGRVEHWSDAELFWIVRNGIQFTGMPSWSGDDRDDEVWAMVAFLRRLPSLGPDAYDELATGNRPDIELGAAELAESGTTLLSLAACSRCHDTPEQPPASTLVPRLGGQTIEYLRQSLREYRDGLRPSGIMQPVAMELTEQAMADLAGYYSALDSPRDASLALPAVSGSGSVPDAARGAVLARDGDAVRDVPACDSCHGSGARRHYPRLAGQSFAYQVAQLELWRRGGRIESEPGRTMAVIAERMTPAQVRDVSAHYAALETSALAQSDVTSAAEPGEW